MAAKAAAVQMDQMDLVANVEKAAKAANQVVPRRLNVTTAVAITSRRTVGSKAEVRTSPLGARVARKEKAKAAKVAKAAKMEEKAATEEKAAKTEAAAKEDSTPIKEIHIRKDMAKGQKDTEKPEKDLDTKALATSAAK